MCVCVKAILCYIIKIPIVYKCACILLSLQALL